MAVAYDNSVQITGYTVVSLTTGSFTIGSGNTCAFLAVAGGYTGSAPTSPSGSAGGATASVLSGASCTDGAGDAAFALYAINPASGSQTASASWTNTMDFAVLTVVTATGVDQATGMNNGNSNTDGYGPGVSVQITSTSGDLTTTCHFEGNAADGATTNQTIHVHTSGASCDTGPGTGTTTHTWTVAGGGNSAEVLVGGNFKAAAAAGGFASSMTLGFTKGS